LRSKADSERLLQEFAMKPFAVRTSEGAPSAAGLECFPRLLELDDDDLQKVRMHLCRLDAEDRHLRFQRSMSDADIQAFVESPRHAQPRRLGFVDAEGHVVALVEGFSFRVGEHTQIELAFSTDREWRNRGLATQLFCAIARQGGPTGAARLVLQCSSRNLPMRRLLRSVGAQTREDGGEVDAVWMCGTDGA
jgi:RimJ/RimL family protein N-acetyltransferase